MRFDRLLALLGTGWAIQPEALTAMAEALDTLMAGSLPRVEAFAAGDAQKAEDLPYELRGDVAVIPVVGTLVKRNAWLSCFTTYAEVQAAMAQARDDPRAAALLLLEESPGGTVDGCQEFAEWVKALDAVKPVYAYADGLMASAAYWIGSGAREIAAPPTAVVGSIGVLAVHHDRSGADERAGVKRTFLSAGKFKALGHDAAPLSDAARGVMQGFLDDTYAIFLRGVCANRGLDIAAAPDWADGKTFLAEAARQAGLIDHVMNLDAFLGRIQAQLASGQTTKGVQTMDLKTLKAEHPALVRELRGEFEAEAQAEALGAAQALAEAVRAERGGVLAVAGAMLGKETADALSLKLESLDKAGLAPEQIKALAESGLLAQAASPKGGEKPDAKAEMLAALKAASPDPVSPAEKASEGKQQQDALVSGLVQGLKGGK